MPQDITKLTSKTYLFGDLEVILTGRYSDKTVANAKHRFVEIKSIHLHWSTFVDINVLSEIKTHPS